MGSLTTINSGVASPMTIKNLFNREDVKKKFQEMLGNRASQFITSVLQIATSSDMLAKADPMSIYNAAAVAATLDLPLNNQLGFAYIVPFNSKQKDGSYKVSAQFMIGYKGFIQLAQRSGQFKTISAAPIFEGQLIEQNPLTGFVFDFTKKKSNSITGYAAYFELINGFQKTMYMTVEEMKAHGTRFSQTYKKGFGLWKDDFDSMATKTVIKLLLSKFAPLSVEMQKAIITDQGVITNPEQNEVEYADHAEVVVEDTKEEERIKLLIQDCTSVQELERLKHLADTIDISIAYQDHFDYLQEQEQKSTKG